MKILFAMLLLAVTCNLYAQQAVSDTVFSRVTTKEARAARYKYLVDTTIKQYLQDPLNEDNEGEWQDALWSMELLQYKDDFTRQKLAVAWNKPWQRSDAFQKNLLETTYSLYVDAFKPQALQLMKETQSVPVFLRCAEYVLRADTVTAKALITPLIQARFAADSSIGLKILQSRLNTNLQQPLPPLKDIFNADFLPGKTVIYSLQRSNRNYAGLVLIRRPGGGFVKDSTGNYFHTAQLAKAITAYPYYITNGNTPQGIIRFNGFGNSRLLYIGPTTNLQMQIPYEATPQDFFADSSLTDTAWSTALYASLLPQSWRVYNGIYESLYAGAMGRNDIIMHGTTIDPEFYKAQTYYPQTPSLGCLCSYENWNDSGYRTGSNQQQIVDVLNSIGCSNGYVVVINIDDKKKNVDIGEIKPLLDEINYQQSRQAQAAANR